MNDPDQDLVNLEDVRRMIAWIEEARGLLERSRFFILEYRSMLKDDVRSREVSETTERIREYLKRVWRK